MTEQSLFLILFPHKTLRVIKLLILTKTSYNVYKTAERFEIYSWMKNGNIREKLECIWDERALTFPH